MPDCNVLQTRRVTVIGAGALGSELCLQLMQAGVRDVLVIDPDGVEERNIPFSRMFQQLSMKAPAGHALAGQGKARLMAEAARALHLPWRWLAIEIADVGLGELAGMDLLLSCTDSALARVETCWTAQALGLPMLDGAVRADANDLQGRVTWFAPEAASACFLCGLTESRRADLLAYALSQSLGCAAQPGFAAMAGPPEMLRTVAEQMLALLEQWSRPEGAGRNCAPMQHSFALRLGGQEPLERIELTPGAGCPWHQLPAPAELVAIRPGESVRAALDRLRLSAATLELAWPLCVRARCLSCHRSCSPMQRAALVRRHARCAHCGAGRLEPLELLRTLTATMPGAERTAPELGLPVNQLFAVRQPFRWGAEKGLADAPKSQSTVERPG